MVVRIGEVVHETAPAAEVPAATAAAADMPSPAEFGIRVIAVVRREAARRDRLWAD